MKRLKLEDFKAKKLTTIDEVKTEELLGQVLGDCHDGELVPKKGGGHGGTIPAEY